MALRTTRRDLVEAALARERAKKTAARKKAWEDVERARVSAGRKPRRRPSFPKANLNAVERAAIATTVRPHSLIDYAFRLRIKTNYEDINMFTDGPIDATSSRSVNRDVVSLTAASLLVAELHVARLIGGQVFAAIADGWLGVHANLPPQLHVGLRARRHLLP